MLRDVGLLDRDVCDDARRAMHEADENLHGNSELMVNVCCV